MRGAPLRAPGIRGRRVLLTALPALAAALAAASLSFVIAAGDAGGRLRGEARTERRRPVVGATVLAVRMQAPPVLAVTATDANGFLALDDVPAGDYSVHVAAPGYAPGRIESLAVGGPFRAVADIVMRSGDADLPVVDLAAGAGGATISLEVVGDAGAPLQSVEVRLDPVGHRHDPVRALSDVDGLARLGGLGDGLWRITLSRAGWTKLRVPAIRWNGGEARLIARLLPLPSAVRPTAAELIPPPRFLVPDAPLELPPQDDPAEDGSADVRPDGSTDDGRGAEEGPIPVGDRGAR